MWNTCGTHLDHLYPTTIYYSDRKVLSSPQDSTASIDNWITRKDLIKAMQQKKVRWIVGKNSDMENLRVQANKVNIKLLRVNDEEMIGTID